MSSYGQYYLARRIAHDMDREGIKPPLLARICGSVICLCGLVMALWWLAVFAIVGFALMGIDIT